MGVILCAVMELAMGLLNNAIIFVGINLLINSVVANISFVSLIQVYFHL